MSIRDPRIKDFFDADVDLWCQSIKEYPGEIHAGIVHRVIKDFGYVIRAAVKHTYAFDILEVAEALSASAKYLVSKKEIAFSILGQFYPPYMYEEDQIQTMTEIVEQVENEFGGAHDRLERRWNKEYEVNKELALKKAAEHQEKAKIKAENQSYSDVESMPLE